MQWYIIEGQKKHWQKYTYEQYQQMKNQKSLADSVVHRFKFLGIPLDF